MYISDKFPWRYAVRPNCLRPRLLSLRHCLFALWRYLRIAYTVSYNSRTISDLNLTRLLLHIKDAFAHFNVDCEQLLKRTSTSQHLGKYQEIVHFHFESSWQWVRLLSKEWIRCVLVWWLKSVQPNPPGKRNIFSSWSILKRTPLAQHGILFLRWVHTWIRPIALKIL